MRRMSAARREAGIEITPLIDVVFLLLIFFMVSSSFVQKQVISVTLPESGTAVANVSDTVEIRSTPLACILLRGSLWGASEQLLAAMQSIVRTLDARALAEQPQKFEQMPMPLINRWYVRWMFASHWAWCR